MPLRQQIAAALCVVSVLLCAAEPRAEPPPVPFRLLTPDDSATTELTVQSGGTLRVRVSVGRDSGARRVNYYWYRGDEPPQSPQQAEPALVADASAVPPFGGAVPVPIDAIGSMRLLAIAEMAQGRMGTTTEFDERVIWVEPSSPILSVDCRCARPWILEPVGKLATIPLLVTEADGRTRMLDGHATQRPKEIAARSSDETILQVRAGGMVQALAPGRVTLTVGYAGRQTSIDVWVRGAGDAESDESARNALPHADAGPLQRVKSGASVRLNAGASADPDGDPLHFEWTQVRGMKVDLVGPNEVLASFVAPKVSLPRLLRFRLDVVDMLGPDAIKGGDALPAYVDVWVEP